MSPVPVSKCSYHENHCLHLREIWQKYAKMTYVHDCILSFELVDFKSNQYAVKVAKIMYALHEENIDITFKLVFGCVPKIYIILKTNEYFYTRIEQFMAKSHMY